VVAPVDENNELVEAGAANNGAEVLDVAKLNEGAAVETADVPLKSEGADEAGPEKLKPGVAEVFPKEKPVEGCPKLVELKAGATEEAGALAPNDNDG